MPPSQQLVFPTCCDNIPLRSYVGFVPRLAVFRGCSCLGERTTYDVIWIWIDGLCTIIYAHSHYVASHAALTLVCAFAAGRFRRSNRGRWVGAGGR